MAESRKVELGQQQNGSGDAFRTTASRADSTDPDFVWSREEQEHMDAEFDRWSTGGFVGAEDVVRMYLDTAGQLTKPEAEDTISEFDSDGDGKLNREEFLQMFLVKTTDADIREGFAAIDLELQGAITPAELR